MFMIVVAAATLLISGTAPTSGAQDTALPEDFLITLDAISLQSKRHFHLNQHWHRFPTQNGRLELSRPNRRNRRHIQVRVE